jgi:hypothetical protein
MDVHPGNLLIDKLRARAEHCRGNAQRSPNPADRAQWLTFAHRWLQFADHEQRQIRSQFILGATGLPVSASYRAS